MASKCVSKSRQANDEGYSPYEGFLGLAHLLAASCSFSHSLRDAEASTRALAPARPRPLRIRPKPTARPTRRSFTAAYFSLLIWRSAARLSASCADRSRWCCHRQGLPPPADCQVLNVRFRGGQGRRIRHCYLLLPLSVLAVTGYFLPLVGGLMPLRFLHCVPS